MVYCCKLILNWYTNILIGVAGDDIIIGGKSKDVALGMPVNVTGLDVQAILETH